jgi:hypothetical protein
MRDVNQMEENLKGFSAQFEHKQPIRVPQIESLPSEITDSSIKSVHRDATKSAEQIEKDFVKLDQKKQALKDRTSALVELLENIASFIRRNVGNIPTESTPTETRSETDLKTEKQKNDGTLQMMIRMLRLIQFTKDTVKKTQDEFVFKKIKE